MASGTAQAEDVFTGLLDNIPETPPLTWEGFTLYGNVDVAVQYQSRGTPQDSRLYSTLGIIAPQSRKAMIVAADNQASQSLIGLRTEQDLGYDIKLIGKMEIGFNPTSLRLSDALGSVRDQNGLTSVHQTTSSDGPRAGQLLNGDAYGGFSSPQFGTITVGRQSTLSTDSLGTYDPLFSYGFSLVGYQGIAGGQGGSEEVRVDSSVKYAYTLGPVHALFLYAAPDSSMKRLWQAKAGFTWEGFSLDAIGGRAYDEISPSALSGTAHIGSPYLGAKVFDTAMTGVFGAYKYDLSPESNLTASAGWERIDFSNPSDGGWWPGHSIIGGYVLGPGLSTTGMGSGGIVNYGFTGGDRVLNITFAALKYQADPKWSFRIGYYRYDQNSFGLGVPSVAAQSAAFYSKTSCTSSRFANCAGTEQVYGFRIDYQMNRNMTLYTGIAYSAVGDGLAFGYLHSAAIDPTAGLKLTF